jgi:hypothetical protein
MGNPVQYVPPQLLRGGLVYGGDGCLSGSHSNSGSPICLAAMKSFKPSRNRAFYFRQCIASLMAALPKDWQPTQPSNRASHADSSLLTVRHVQLTRSHSIRVFYKETLNIACSGLHYA